MSSSIDEPKHWRARADEALRIAEQMGTFASKEMMLRVAANYERLAEDAEADGEAFPTNIRAMPQSALGTDVHKHCRVSTAPMGRSGLFRKHDRSRSGGQIGRLLEGHSRPASRIPGQCRGYPAGLGAGVERLHRLPAHAGVPQHRWGVFLNDFDPVHTWPRRLG